MIRKMKQNVFITGTDTGVGKTWFTVALMNQLNQAGVEVAGMKPVASGSQWRNGRFENQDTLMIQQACSQRLDYEVINPIAYEPPIAPHIAADLADRAIDLHMIVNAYETLSDQHEIVVVEGIGGWRVPLSADATLSDLVRELQLPVIMVVGLRLGCINHAILTAEAIRNDDFELLGWVATELETDYLNKVETLLALEQRLDCPMLAEMPYNTAIPDHDQIQINVEPLS